MANTQNRGYPYPIDSAMPDVPADIRALAEAVDTDVAAMAITNADLAARVAALEDGTGGAGWIPIGTGNASGSGFSIDLTAGGKFPDPPLWNLIQVHMRADLDNTGEIRMSINGENDNVYRSGSFMMDSVVPANSDTDNWHRANQSSWSLAQLSTISTGLLTLTLFHTAANPGLISFQCIGTRQSDDPSAHRNQISSGALTTAKTVSSLTFGVGAGATSFVNAWWWATGMRIAAP